MVAAHSDVGFDACYPALAPRVADIRRAVAEVAAGYGADETLLVRIGLAVSEAATNVVLHAYREPAATSGLIHVDARLRDNRSFVVSVRDNGIGMSPRTDSPGLGLGIALMAHESDDLEIRAGDDGGTEILLHFELR